MAGQPVPANAPTFNAPEMIAQGSGPQTAVADPRARYLAEALAGLHDQAKTIRTPTSLAADLLAEALLQRRYGAPQNPEGLSPAYAPQGRLAPVFQATPIPSPSPGVPPPSAPAGTASAVPAAASPAAGAAMAAALKDARAAISKGADPAKVRARLVAHGYDPRAL